MGRILGTILGEGFTCDVHEGDDGRVHFVADADIDADGANGQGGGRCAGKERHAGTFAPRTRKRSMHSGLYWNEHRPAVVTDSRPP